MTTTLNREDDGVRHINCWSKARTALGQLLSNFANTPFHHPQHGAFASVEGFWYWCATGMKHTQLRRLYGASAKSYGSKLPRVEMDEETFRDLIRSAIRCKLEQNSKLRDLFIESTLPFEHYFVYGPKSEIIVQKDKHRWQMEYLEQLRDEWRLARGLPLPPHRQGVVPVPKVDMATGPEVKNDPVPTPTPSDSIEPSPF